MTAPRLAVFGFPSDRGQGGGFSLLARLGPALARVGGALAWVEDLYADDAVRRERWLRENVTLIPLNPPRRRLARWRDRRDGLLTGCERAIDAFRPNLVIVVAGTDQPRAGDLWQLKRDLALRYTRAGARLIFMHQLSEPGRWIEPVGEAIDWLAWQRSADLHQFVSASTWRETEANFGFPLEGEVIRNNYNVPHADAPAWPNEQVLRLAFVGRFDIHQKGLDLLLDALAHPSLTTRPDWTCDFFGAGHATPLIEARIRTLGLAERVRLPGRVNNVRAIWETHHLLVMPSRAEGLSLSLVEAMLCERPVVASLAGGTGELLTDGETGWRTQLDAEHIAHQLSLALSAFSNGKLHSMGQAAGARARSVFPSQPEDVYVERLVNCLATPRRHDANA